MESPEELQKYFDRNWDEFERAVLEDRRDMRFARLIRRLSRRRKFKDEATARRFHEKEQRLRTAAALGVPDRVPIITGDQIL